MVERDLAKVEVAGSTPVSRSSGVSLPTFPCQQPRFTFHLAHQARYPSGKGEVCKTFMRRFDPDPRLQSFQSIGLSFLGNDHRPQLNMQRRLAFLVSAADIGRIAHSIIPVATVRRLRNAAVLSPWAAIAGGLGLRRAWSADRRDRRSAARGQPALRRGVRPGSNSIG